MKEDKDPKLVDLPVRLSQSKLWQIQRNYFTTMGVKAWKEEVPYYISSNAFIGHRYATIVIHFIREWKKLNPQFQNETFTILEVGSGMGKFSFHFLTAFKALLKDYELQSLKFCYVISDIPENNLTFCQENTSLMPFIQNQELDFSIFNVEEDKDFTLRIQNKRFSELQSKTPLIVIANYTFDCIIHDAFHFNKDKLEEVQLGLRSRYKNFDVQKSLHLNDLRFNYRHVDIDIANYYDDPKLNEILKGYQEYFHEQGSYFLIPLGAIQFLNTLKNLTNNNFFMIAGDKGLTLPETFPLLGDHYDASYDGCYSYLVNFHAMGEYLKKDGGDCLLTQNDNDFKVNLFSIGTSFADLTETTAYFNNVLESTGPDEYCQFYDEYQSSSYRFDLKSLLAFIRFSYWDPNAYSIVHGRLLELLDDAQKNHIEEIKRDLNKLKSNIFKMNIGEDVYNQIGLFYQIIGTYDVALELYQESISIYGDRAAPHNNAAVIYEKQKNMGKALTHYQKSYELDKKNQYAFKKIHYLTGRPYLALLYPILKGVLVLALMGGALYLLTH